MASEIKTFLCSVCRGVSLQPAGQIAPMGEIEERGQVVGQPDGCSRLVR